jgi:uncharacterized protein
MVLVSKPLKRVTKIESELGRLEFLVPDIVEAELERLAQKAGPKRSRLAKTALEIARNKFQKVHLQPARHVDDSIIDYAMVQKCAVATIDTNLRRRLIDNQVLVLSLSNDNLIVANPKIRAKDHL